MWWFTERCVVLFLSTILCSPSVWAVTRTQNCPSILEGIPDQILITGKLFVYKFAENAFNCKKNCSLYISSASQDQKLPQWISFDETTRKLIAVPTMQDAFGLYIKVTLSDRENTCGDIYDIFYLEIKPYSVSYEYNKNNKHEKTCYKGIKLIQTTLIFAVNLYKLDALARYNVMKNLADFLDINKTLITISASKELFSMQDKSKSYSILASGRGNTDAVLPNVTELTWRVPCSVFKEVSLFMQVLQHNVEGGRLTREVGYDVIGWYISALVNPSKQYRPRKKRALPKVSTPTPTPQIHLVPATKALTSSLYSASLKTELLKSSMKLEPKDYETKRDYDHITDHVTPIRESSATFVYSRESAIEVEPTKSFTLSSPSESLFEKLKTVPLESSADQLRPTPTSTYSEYIPKETGQPDRHATTVQWRESSKYHTGIYEISGSGDVSRFSEFTTEDPITPPTGFGEDFTKRPMTPLIAATPTLSTDTDGTDGDKDIIGTDLDYYGSGSGSGSGDEDIDEEEDTTTEIALEPSESSIVEKSTSIIKTLYVDQTDTNTFYFEESEITVQNIPQSTTHEETVTPTLSTVSSVSWPSGVVPIDLLTSLELTAVTTSSSRASVTHKSSQSSKESSSMPVRPTTRIMSGHSYIDSQIGGQSSVPVQPSGSSSGHSHVDSRIDGHSSIHVEPSQSRSGHSYVDIRPAHSSGQSYDEIRPTHSSGQSYIVHQPSLKVNETSIDIKSLDISSNSSIYRRPFPTIDGSSSTVFKPFSRVDQSSVHLKVPDSHAIFSYISQSQSYRANQSKGKIPSSSFHVEPSLSRPYPPSTGHKSSGQHEYSSVPLKPSHSKTHYSSLHVRPSHGRVEPSSEIKPMTKSVDLLSTGISQSHGRVDRSSEQIRPSRSSDSFYSKPSHTHILERSYTDLRPSSHSSDYPTLMPSSSVIREHPSREVGTFSLSRQIHSSEGRLPIVSRDISSREQNLTSMLLRPSTQRQDMISSSFSSSSSSSSSHILLPPSHSREKYYPSSSSMSHYLSKTKDIDSKRLYSTPVVFPTTTGFTRSKDYEDTVIIPEQPKYSSTKCISGYGCTTQLSRESVTRTSSSFPYEHTKTVDAYFTTESADSNKRVTTTTDKDYFVTKQIPKWYTVESTTELTTVRSRKTSKKKKPRKQGQDFDNKKSKHTNMAPNVTNPIRKIYTYVGRTFEFQIPENTFNDLEDGSTRNLTLDFALEWDSYNPPTYIQSWVQFHEAKQTISGLPLPRDVKESPVKITINAIDQGGKIAQDIVLIYINSTDSGRLPTQEFFMRFDVNGRRFLNDRRKFKNLIKKLSAYFGDRDSSYITVLDTRPGSLIVTWTNNSIATDRCDNATIHEMKQKVVDFRGYINPKFSKYMLPKYKVTDVEFQLKGACQDVSEPSGAGGLADVDPWAEAIIPTVIAIAIAIFIVVIILLVCSRKQNKEKNKQKEPRHSFEDQDPVMFHREQAQKDKAIRSKRAVILPGDGKPKPSGRRKFSPQIGLPYQPSTFDEQECPSDEEIYGNENVTYSNTYTQPPPPYRLPPPYHVDNGSSYV